MLIPYQAEVVMERWPIANWVIIALTVLISFWGFFAPSNIGAVDAPPIFENVEDIPPEWLENEALREFFEPAEHKPTVFDRMVLDGWSVPGLFTYMFLHGDFFHLLGNMIFLFVFGNAVCAKVGNLWYPLFYFLAGLIAAVAHVLFSEGLALGASGAVNGVVGFFLVYYPINEIHCAYIYYPFGGSFSVSSYVMILIWFGLDLLGAFYFDDGVAYAAHIGGFLLGFGIASYLLLFRILTATRYERSIFDALKGRTT